MLDNLYMIVAATEQTRSIGLEGQMIHHLPQDLKYFKDVTTGHTIVCGRRTYYTFPKRPLPNRKNIILTRSSEEFEGAETMSSKEELLQYAKENPEEKIFIVGGDNVYAQFIKHASLLYVTEIKENYPIVADTFFPKFDKSLYEIIEESDYIVPDEGPEFKFVVYKKIKEHLE